MGRAIVRKPAVFLFDEPLSNLDAKLRVQMRIEIRRLQRRLGTTSVYVTHDQLEAMTLADMLVVMNAGRVEQAGAPLELYERPATTFVGGFIGSPPMNFLAGTVTGPGQVTLDDRERCLPTPLSDFAAAPGARVTVGLRPERIAFSQPMARVCRSRPTLSRISGSASSCTAMSETASLPSRLPAGVMQPQGDALSLRVPVEAVHLFDAATGRTPLV